MPISLKESRRASELSAGSDVTRSKFGPRECLSITGVAASQRWPPVYSAAPPNRRLPPTAAGKIVSPRG
jgi:hypothetical protein